MKNKLIQNFSANTLQLIVNQLAGLAIFYILSTGLDKTGFGQLNLALSILLVSFNLLSLGIDQISIRKIAAGHDPESLLSTYLVHVLFTGLSFYAFVIFISLFFREDGFFTLLLLIGAGKLMIYFSTPFKQLVSGLERFKVLAVMLTVSNLVRAIGLGFLFLSHQLSLQTATLIFMTGDVMELIFCIYFFKNNTRIPVVPAWNKQAYLSLLRESLPQTGVTILTSAIARFDWIFIGLIVSSARLAEYSFAYKVFEISTFPLLAIAPLLIPRFTKMFKDNQVNPKELRLLIRAELLVAALTVVVLNAAWIPVIDKVTGGKYGVVNADTIFILSLCIPFLYLNNFFWTIYFAQNRMRMILKGFVITFCINVGLDILLIPFWGNQGAAIAFLVSCAAQGVFYVSQNHISELRSLRYQLIIYLFIAVSGAFFAKTFFPNFVGPRQATITLLPPY